MTHAHFPPPRDFQSAAHEALRQGIRDGHRCQMLCAPTGAGKTYLGLRLISEALAKGRRGIFVCDRVTLIEQTSVAADSYGLDHGVIQANHRRTNNDMPFQIASAQTLERRQWPETDVIVIDEAHTQLGAWTRHIPIVKAAVVGLSATPFSAGLGKLFTNLVNAATMEELTRTGVLVSMRVFSCTRPDMTGAATSGGEWTELAAAERGMAIIGDVVTEWQRLGENRKTIVFGSTIVHCEELCRQFCEAGVMAAVFTSRTSKTEREDLLLEYRKEDSVLRVLVSVEALAKGFDVPDVACVIDCRPLRKSLSTCVQMWGRGLRSAPGKVDCILLDHSGNIVRFANDFERLFFQGAGDLDTAQNLDRPIRTEAEEDNVKGCPACGFQPFRQHCMACGHEARKLALVEHEACGEMREIVIGKSKAADNAMHLWQQLCSYFRSRGKPETRQGRAAHMYRDIVGAFPPGGCHIDSTPETDISRTVIDKIRSRNIAFAKAGNQRV